MILNSISTTQTSANTGSLHTQSSNISSLNEMNMIKSAEQICEQLSLEMQRGYYRSMEIAYKTWNFNIDSIRESSGEPITMKSGDEMETEGETIYLPEVVLVGNIFKLQDFSLKEGDQKTSDILRVRFKSTFDGKQKCLLIQKSQYRNNFVKHFNRMLKNKTQKYLLTNLTPVLYTTSPSSSQSSTIYFLIQQNTQLIHITQQYYNKNLRPIERINDQDFKFSNLKLSKIYSVDQLDKNCKDGFILAQVRQKFQSKEKQSLIIVGLLTWMEKVVDREKGRNNKKEILLWVTETMFRRGKPGLRKNCAGIKVPQIGCCKIIIRYSPSDQSQIESLFSLGHIYLISDPQIMITQTANILYLINISKNSTKSSNLLRLSDEPKQVLSMMGRTNTNKSQFNIDEVQNILDIELQRIQINNLLQKCINRNIIKIHVGLLQVQILYGSIRCAKCKVEIRRNQELDRIVSSYEKYEETSDNYIRDQELKEMYCRSKHKEYHCLQLWGTVRAADQSGSCLMSLQHKQIIRFLQLQPYLETFQKLIYENGKGRVLLTSNRPKQTQMIDPLTCIQHRLRKSYVQKTIIGQCKTQLDKTFRQSLSEMQQLQYHDSFQNSKKYLQQKKIFPNGIIQKKGQEMLLLPFVKVLQVVDEMW